MKDMLFSVPVAGTETPTTTAVRRAPEYPDKLLALIPGLEQLQTLKEVFSHAVERHGSSPWLGSRPIKEGVATDFVWQTYAEVRHRDRATTTCTIDEHLFPS